VAEAIKDNYTVSPLLKLGLVRQKVETSVQCTNLGQIMCTRYAYQLNNEKELGCKLLLVVK